MQLLWDQRKEKINFRKHGVLFTEAATALKDTLSVTGYDPDHSESEYRFITFGVSSQGRLLIVSHTEEETIIRIISCRVAEKHERKIYEEA
jgi:hypothetical protein